MVGMSKTDCVAGRIIISVSVCASLLLFNIKTEAQEMPPRPIGVSLIQNLSFGAFSVGQTGGTVTIYPYGSRSSTGSIILVNLGFLYYPAVFGLVGNPGTIVHFMAGPPAILTGNHGGFLTLQIGSPDVGDPIILSVAPPGQMQIRVGGTLIVGSPSANPGGTYTGTFLVMFIQE